MSNLKFDPHDMAMRGRIGAYRLHATHDSRVTSEPGRRAARTALDVRLLAEIDARGELSPEERARRLGHARAAVFAQMGRKSALSRRRGKARPATGVGSQ